MKNYYIFQKQIWKCRFVYDIFHVLEMLAQFRSKAETWSALVVKAAGQQLIALLKTANHCSCSCNGYFIFYKFCSYSKYLAMLDYSTPLPLLILVLFQSICTRFFHGEGTSSMNPRSIGNKSKWSEVDLEPIQLR